MNNFLKSIYNEIDFFFRKNIKFSRRYNAKNEPKENFVFPEKEKLYYEKYNLTYLKNNSTIRNYQENLATIELLENMLLPLEPVNKNPVKILDIGSKNWFYASAQWHFFKYNLPEKDIFLDGIEIDAFRVYSNLYTRQDYARFYIKNLQNTCYIAKDFLNHTEKYDYILWFFPFVTEFPLLEWGLPLSVYNPEKMLCHAYKSLNHGGKILIINQDEHEYSIQAELIKKTGLPYEQKNEFINSFIEYERKRLVTIIQK